MSPDIDFEINYVTFAKLLKHLLNDKMNSVIWKVLPKTHIFLLALLTSFFE